MSKDTHEENEKSSHGMSIGLGIAAVAAAAAGAYYLYGSDKAAKNRRMVKSWMLKMKAEVMDEIESAKEVSQETYSEAVDKISSKYSKLKDVDKKELADLVDRMKSHWKEIKEDIGETAGTVKDKSVKALKSK